MNDECGSRSTLGAFCGKEKYHDGAHVAVDDNSVTGWANTTKKED